MSNPTNTNQASEDELDKILHGITGSKNLRPQRGVLAHSRIEAKQAILDWHNKHRGGRAMSKNTTDLREQTFESKLDEILADYGENVADQFGGDTDEHPVVSSYILEAKQALLDWHNKQVEEVLGRLGGNKETLYWWTGGEYEKTTAVDMRAIAAERAKLKEVK